MDRVPRKAGSGNGDLAAKARGRGAALCAAALMLFSGPALSATLRLTATAPVYDDDGTCAEPVLLSVPAGTQRVMHFAWSGPSAGEDSVVVAAGERVSFSRQVPAGVYSVRAWASDVGGVGCDTTIVVDVRARPDKIREVAR